MAWVYFFNRDKGFGQVAVYWLASTWISTIILGVPISTAVFGSPAVGLKYGVVRFFMLQRATLLANHFSVVVAIQLAGISSFIFQLPLQLFFLEYHAETWVMDTTTDMDEKESIDKDIEHEVEEQVLVDEYDDVERDGEEETSESAAARNTLAQTSSSVNLQVAKKVGRRIVRNPVLWGIVLGFTLSLSTLGPTFLHPKKPDYVPGLGWVWTTAEWFGDCVSPVSLFAMGLWMQSQGLNLFRLGWRDSCLFMLMKLVLVPLIMLGLACAASLDDEAGRAAVLIATLPISMASFTLADVFDIGQAILAQNVAMGTILLLPTVLIWNLVLDHAGVFPIS